MANTYSYMRISTAEERGKQGYHRQERALKYWAEHHDTEFILQFKEDKSGKDFKNRVEWNKLEKIVQPGDCIVFKDITRFTRQAQEGYDCYMKLFNDGVTLVFIDNPTLCTDYVKNLLHLAEEQELVVKTVMESMVKILLIAELERSEKERNIISQRTKDGMKARKLEAEDRGEVWKPGRKPGTMEKMTDELREDIRHYLTDRSVKGIEIMKKHGISRNTFRKYCDILKNEK